MLNKVKYTHNGGYCYDPSTSGSLTCIAMMNYCHGNLKVGGSVSCSG